jgi:hypothetical protein
LRGGPRHGHAPIDVLLWTGGSAGWADTVLRMSAAGTELSGRVARAMAASATASSVSGGTRRSCRLCRPSQLAVRRTSGCVVNQPIRTSRPATRSLEGRLAHVPWPRMRHGTGAPRRSSTSRTSPGSSLSGSSDRGHQAPWTGARRKSVGAHCTRGVDGAVDPGAGRRPSVVKGTGDSSPRNACRPSRCP